MSFEGTTKDVPVGQVISLEFDDVPVSQVISLEFDLILSEFTGCNEHDL
jgi:hypothetical protein